MKLAIVVRKDIGMRSGKIAVQAAHAAISAYRNTPDARRQDWYYGGQKKIVLKCNSEQNIKDLAEIARNFTSVVEIRDMGLTQVEPDTLTCIGIGPDEDEIIDKLIGGLSLL